MSKIYIVAFSGGKDSVAMTLHLLEQGVSKSSIHLHHHDVDGAGDNIWDWGGTRSYCEAFAKEMGLQLFFSYRNGGIHREMMRENSGLQDVYYQSEPDGMFNILQSRPGNSTRRKFPAVAASLQTRWCSSCVKIDVLRRVIPAMYKEGEYVVCTGERKEESANRAKYAQTERHVCSSSKRDVTAWRPMLCYEEMDVWDTLQRWKIQPHPCYELGYPRCSCQICIFGSANIWASNYELSPEKVQFIAEREKELLHTLYDGMTIHDKVSKGTSFIKPDKKARWASEALHRFTSPIIVPGIWKLPDGAYKRESAGSL